MLQPDSSADFGVKFVVVFKLIILETFLNNLFILNAFLRILDFSRNESVVSSQNPLKKEFSGNYNTLYNELSLCFTQ